MNSNLGVGKKSSWRNISYLTVAGAFLMGGLLGWGITHSYSQKSGDGGLPTVGIGGGPIETNQPNGAQFPLNNLLREHGNLAVLHLQAIYDDKDPLPTGQQLDTNSQQIADLFSGVFGAQAGERIQPIWKDHINEYVNYTYALKNNDQAELNRVRLRLTEIGTEMGKVIHEMNGNLKPEDVSKHTNDHILLTLSIIDSHSKGDQDAMIKQIKASQEHATKFAVYIAERLNAQSSGTAVINSL